MLEVVVFVCGAAVMILEMVGSRVLAPFLGTSIVVWTSLIGVVLASLSLGYWLGGVISDRRPERRLLGVVILMAGLLVGVISLTKTMILGFLQQYAGSGRAGAAAATVLLFAPPSVLLGMVSPFAARLKMADVAHSGRTVGGLYALSTVGSIVGTFLAGFLLISYLGTTNILIVLAAGLVLTSMLAAPRDLAAKLAALAILGLLLMAMRSLDAYLAEAGVLDFDTAYSRILVYDSKESVTGRPTRVLITDPHGIQSAMYQDDPSELAVDYTRFYTLASHFDPAMRRVLMLGGGGYSYPKHLLAHHPEVSLDVVEIDPKVTDIARAYFGLGQDPRLSIHHEDARAFINRSHQPYDVILADTFSSHYSIPFHLSTIETVRRIRDLLSDDGVVIVNILSAIEGERGQFLRAMHAAYQEVFPRTLLFAVNHPRTPGAWQNIMLVALKSPGEPSLHSDDPEIAELLSHRFTGDIPHDVPVMTDDFAPVDRYVLRLQ